MMALFRHKPFVVFVSLLCCLCLIVCVVPSPKAHAVGEGALTDPEILGLLGLLFATAASAAGMQTEVTADYIPNPNSDYTPNELGSLGLFFLQAYYQALHPSDVDYTTEYFRSTFRDYATGNLLSTTTNPLLTDFFTELGFDSEYANGLTDADLFAWVATNTGAGSVLEMTSVFAGVFADVLGFLNTDVLGATDASAIDGSHAGTGGNFYSGSDPITSISGLTLVSLPVTLYRSSTQHIGFDGPASVAIAFLPTVNDTLWPYFFSSSPFTAYYHGLTTSNNPTWSSISGELQPCGLYVAHPTVNFSSTAYDISSSLISTISNADLQTVLSSSTSQTVSDISTVISADYKESVEEMLYPQDEVEDFPNVESVPYATSIPYEDVESMPTVEDLLEYASELYADGDLVSDYADTGSPSLTPPTIATLPIFNLPLPSFNFSLSGIWYYVVQWVNSISAWVSEMFTVWNLLPAAMVYPVYATAVIVIVIGVYRRFFM